MTVQTFEEVCEPAQQLQVDSIRCSTAAGSGHPASGMSAADVMAALPARHLRYEWRSRTPGQRPADLSWPIGELRLPRYELGAKVATRLAFGQALAAVGARAEVVALDGKAGNCTRAEEFAKTRVVGAYLFSSDARSPRMRNARGSKLKNTLTSWTRHPPLRAAGQLRGGTR